MKTDLTSKLEAAAIDLSHANTAKLNQAVDIAMSEIQRQSQAIETKRSASAESFLQSFEQDLENCKKCARKINEENDALKAKIKTLHEQMDATSEAIKVQTMTRAKICGLLIAGCLICAALVIATTSGVAYRANLRAEHAKEVRLAHLRTLEAFQGRYGVILAQSKKGQPMFILPKGTKMRREFWQGNPLNRPNSWVVR